MKTKLNIFICTLVVFAAVSCSSTRNASAQSGNDEYSQPDYNNDNGYNDNNENYDNDGNYDDGNENENYDDNNANYDDNNYENQSRPEVNIGVFENELRPYGRWMNNSAYGRVWICNEANFEPYNTGGHWAYTVQGWTWVSNYRWGWAPFHYGRWAFETGYGWMWVPGYQWAPAWVSWRGGGDYYGWAPLSPGINLNIGFGIIPAHRWYFCNRRYISRPYIGRYCVNRSRNITIINHTTIINRTNIYRNNRYATGPDRREVERISGHKIQPLKISNSNKPGNDVVGNGTIHIYRPHSAADIKNRVREDNAVKQPGQSGNVNHANHGVVRNNSQNPRTLNSNQQAAPVKEPRNRNPVSMENTQPLQNAQNNNAEPRQPRKKTNLTPNAEVQNNSPVQSRRATRRSAQSNSNSGSSQPTNNAPAQRNIQQRQQTPPQNNNTQQRQSSGNGRQKNKPGN